MGVGSSFSLEYVENKGVVVAAVAESQVVCIQRRTDYGRRKNGDGRASGPKSNLSQKKKRTHTPLLYYGVGVFCCCLNIHETKPATTSDML